jgi:hypothetical protein
VVFPAILGVLLLIGFVAVLRHSRNFRGSGEQFASEERPEMKQSKGSQRNDSGLRF